MADLYAKKLESERKTLWATCRLKGLAKGTPERQRIAELDRLIAEHAAKKSNSSSLSRNDGEGDHPKDSRGASSARDKTAQ
jgi:hypothetical protein